MPSLTGVWEKNKSKGNRPLSEADRLRLNDLEKEVARLRKENAQLKGSKQNNPSTSAAAVGNNIWLLEVWEGRAPCGSMPPPGDNKPTPTKSAPATPRTAGAKSSGSSGKKVSFSKLQLNTAVQEAVTKTTGPRDYGCDGEEGLAEAVTVRPGDAVVRLEAGHLGFNCISGQQGCDRHPQPFRSSGCY